MQEADKVQAFDEGADALTAEEGWQTIHTTMDDARSSMYVAGSTAIMLLSPRGRCTGGIGISDGGDDRRRSRLGPQDRRMVNYR